MPPARKVQLESQRADAVRNREKLLKVARAAVSKGDVSLQLNQLARRAGVGVGTAYRHFPTREDLLETLVNERFQQLIADAEAAEAEADAWSAIERVLRSAFEMELTQPGFASVLAAAEDARAETSQLKLELGTLVHRLLERARKDKCIRTDVDADDIRRLLCGIEHAVSLGDPQDRAAADRLFSVLLDGLRSGTTPKPVRRARP